MSESRSDYNFSPQQQQQQSFYPPNQLQMGPNQFMPPHPGQCFGYLPQMQQFNWPNPQQNNPFMIFTQMPFYPNFNCIPPNQQQMQQQQQPPQFNTRFNNFHSSNNSNNRNSPSKIIDKRFIQNNSNIVKKSF